MVQQSVSAVRTKRVFTEEFQVDAVRLVTVEEGYSFAAAAKSVGVGEPSLRKWHAGLAPQPVPCGAGVSVDELRAEVDRLRRELRRAEIEREILKKATAYFAKGSPVLSEHGEIRLDSSASRPVFRNGAVRGTRSLHLGVLRLGGSS